MTDYHLKWITDNVAAGHAPMSYDQLDEIREAGISAIVNLCGEYCDLHEIEGDSGFEVHYLPVPDECAPVGQEMEEAFLWMDDIIARNEKVLVHCRFGIGRTGTLLLAYLIHQGMPMKAAEKILKKSGTLPSRHCQWKAVRTFNKKVQSAAKMAKN